MVFYTPIPPAVALIEMVSLFCATLTRVVVPVVAVQHSGPVEVHLDEKVDALASRKKHENENEDK